ncbi:MAG: hypothetical protein O3A87_03575 [Verrucomicrobia bacterium]|nr:hypothetical protein [Verrucomicrobiota bacterium]MDA1005543.1 hypothetical protein [Verrucomicrobiota bacterium]
MQHLNNLTVFLKRPITAISVADALGVPAYVLMRPLIELEVFIAPHQGLGDSLLERSRPHRQPHHHPRTLMSGQTATDHKQRGTARERWRPATDYRPNGRRDARAV